MPLASQPITELSSDMRERLGLPQFLHGSLIPSKSVNLTEKSPPESTAKNASENVHQPELTAKTPSQKTTHTTEAARNSSKRIGRPKAQIDVKMAFRMQRDGHTIREIQQALNCGLRTLERELSAYKKRKKRWDF